MHGNSNIEAMQAKEQAQGESLNGNKIFSIVGMLAIVIGALAMMLTWNIIIGIVVGALMGIVGYYRLVPEEINARYFYYGLAQRHSFMSAVTQIFGGGHNSGVTVQSALRGSLTDLRGVFKQNIESLISVIGENGAGHKTHEAFDRLYKHYAGDIWFIDFLEQLETTEDEGVVNADAFHDIMKNANAQFDNQYKYRRIKNARKNAFVITEVLIILAILIIPIKGFGIDNFKSIYAPTGIGYVVTALYLAYTLFTYHLMYKHYYDESITSLK